MEHRSRDVRDVSPPSRDKPQREVSEALPAVTVGHSAPLIPHRCHSAAMGVSLHLLSTALAKKTDALTNRGI